MTEKVCTRCGACCQYLPLFTQHMHTEHKKYLLNRGLYEDKKQGCILIPHRCQHLTIPLHNYETGNLVYSCDIHDSEERPEVCRKFHGQKIHKGARIYVPPQCVFSREGP